MWQRGKVSGRRSNKHEQHLSFNQNATETVHNRSCYLTFLCYLAWLEPQIMFVSLCSCVLCFMFPPHSGCLHQKVLQLVGLSVHSISYVAVTQMMLEWTNMNSQINMYRTRWWLWCLCLQHERHFLSVSLCFSCPRSMNRFVCNSEPSSPKSKLFFFLSLRLRCCLLQHGVHQHSFLDVSS